MGGGGGVVEGEGAAGVSEDGGGDCRQSKE